jgi:hypothetical protein
MAVARKMGLSGLLMSSTTVIWVTKHRKMPGHGNVSAGSDIVYLQHFFLLLPFGRRQHCFAPIFGQFIQYAHRIKQVHCIHLSSSSSRNRLGSTRAEGKQQQIFGEDRGKGLSQVHNNYVWRGFTLQALHCFWQPVLLWLLRSVSSWLAAACPQMQKPHRSPFAAPAEDSHN